jgi:hypothetical protein
LLDPTKVYGECLKSRFPLKLGVTIPDIIRTNNAAVASPMMDVRQLLELKALLVATQGFTGADP